LLATSNSSSLIQFGLYAGRAFKAIPYGTFLRRDRTNYEDFSKFATTSSEI